MGRSRQSLLGAGMPSLVAVAMTGVSSDSLVATGSTQGTALLLSADNNIFTTVAASTGAILRPTADTADEVIVANLGANALSVYPPSGGQINALSANAAFSVPSGKTCKFIARPGGVNWLSLLSA